MCQLPWLVSAAGMLLLFAGGCATVNPQPDYDRVTARVRAATGYAATYRPGEDARVVERVKALLADGLTGDEAVQVCLLNNPELQAAYMNVGMARADVVQSGMLTNPSLGASLRFPAGGGLPNLEANIAQNIAELWQLPIRKRAAEQALDRAVLTVARHVADTAFDTKTAYFTAVAAQQLHKIARENLNIATGLLELTRTRQQLGAASAVDVNLSRGLVLEAELAAQAAQLEQAEARRKLARLLGLTIEADDLVLLDPLPVAASDKLAPESLIRLAAQRRLDLEAARSAAAAAESRLRLEWSRVFPTVALGVALERGERQAPPGRDVLADTARASVATGRLTAPEIQPRSARDADSDFIIGPSLSLELPIFDQNQAQIAKAAYAYEQAAKTLDALERAIVQDVRSAVDRARIAQKTAELYRDQLLPLARSSVEMARDSYRAGKTSFLAVLDAERFLISTRSRSIEAQRAFATALPELERTVGAPLSEVLRVLSESPRAPVPNTPPSTGEPQ